MRDWLDQLSPQTAERIGCSNAHRTILRSRSSLALKISAIAVRTGDATTVEGSVEPAFPGVRIDRVIEGPEGREDRLLWTGAGGRFREDIVMRTAGAHRLLYRALCDGNQPGASATPIAVHVR